MLFLLQGYQKRIWAGKTEACSEVHVHNQYQKHPDFVLPCCMSLSYLYGVGPIGKTTKLKEKSQTVLKNLVFSFCNDLVKRSKPRRSN